MTRTSFAAPTSVASILFVLSVATATPGATPLAAWSFVPSLHRGIDASAKGRSPCTFSSLEEPAGSRRCDDATAASLTMKVSKGKSRKTPRKSSSIAVTHASRVRSAGRVGTKRYVDPTRCFVGNLPYEADEDDILDMLSDHLGPRVVDLNVESVKVVRDWRTGRSKGYGFVQFLDPMMATSAMEGLNGRELMGRRINFGQGQRRQDPDRIWVKRRDKAAEPGDAEGAVLDAALDEAEGGASSLEEVLSVEDFDEADDNSLFDGEGDDEEFEFDGVFEEVYKKELSDDVEEDGTMNRAQRREAAKGKKKRKLPHTGFG